MLYSDDFAKEMKEYGLSYITGASVSEKEANALAKVNVALRKIAKSKFYVSAEKAAEISSREQAERDKKNEPPPIDADDDGDMDDVEKAFLQKLVKKKPKLAKLMAQDLEADEGGGGEIEKPGESKVDNTLEKAGSNPEALKKLANNPKFEDAMKAEAEKTKKEAEALAKQAKETGDKQSAEYAQTTLDLAEADAYMAHYSAKYAESPSPEIMKDWQQATEKREEIAKKAWKQYTQLPDEYKA